MDSKKVGNLIAKLRKEKSLTQQELADLLGVSSKTISKWETGSGLPDISFLKQVSEIFEITIEELLDGTIYNKDISQTKLNKKNILLISLTIFSIITILTIILIYNQNKQVEDPNNCTVIRTYYIDNIGKSNDENYLYITVHEYQVEGTYTLKLPKLISGNLEVGNSYEFTFKTSKRYLMTTTDNLFNNGEVINLKYTDKVGNEQTSEYYCN